MTATAIAVHEATDLKLVGHHDQNEVTETRHAAQVVAVQKHHQNPVARVDARKKADTAQARIEDVAMPDHKLVMTGQVADDLGSIEVLDIAPLNVPNEVPVVDDLILAPTHGTMAQVIDVRVLAHQAVITDHSSVHTAATSATVDPTLNTMPADTAVITPSSAHDTVRCTTADSAHKAVITVHNLVHIAATSVMADLALNIMPKDMVVTIPGSTHDMVQCTTVDSVHTGVITAHSLVRTTATSVLASPASDIMPVDTVVIIPGSTHNTVRCITVDSAHTGVITARSLVYTTGPSVTVDLTLDIMPKATLIISAPILVHDMVARCLDIISVHAKTTAHILVNAVCTPTVMLMRTCLVIISDPTSADDMTPPDATAMKHHHLGIQVAKNDVTLVLNMIGVLALVTVQNHAAPDAMVATRVQWPEILTAMGDRNSDLHAATIEVAPAWARWGMAPAVIIPKRVRHVVTVEVVPNLGLKDVDLVEAECLVSHGDLDEAAPT